MRNRVEIFREIRIDYIGVSPADEPVDFLDCVGRTATGSITIGTALEVRLKDWFQNQLACRLDLGIMTHRTGAGQYVCETSSSRNPANHSSSPDSSMSANVCPSTPGAPAFARANKYACRRMSSR